VRASLAMQRSISILNAENRTNLMLKIGISTGIALVGAIHSADQVTAVGFDVNHARTLQETALPDQIYIGYNTYRHVRSVFEMQRIKSAEEVLRALAHKRGRTIQVYQVLALKPRAFRLASRGVEATTPLIGRMAELERLQRAFREMDESGRLTVYTVTGDVGVGKSRLLYEFDDWLDLIPESVYTFKGRASPSTQSVVNGLLRDLIAFRFEIMDSDMAVEVRRKLERGCADALGDTSETRIKAHLLGTWLGLDFGVSEIVRAAQADRLALKKRALFILHALFGALANRYPVVMLLEDLHWADEGSLRVLQEITRVDRALMIVCTARPLLLERLPDWGQQPGYQRLALQPLGESFCRAVLANLLPNGEAIWERLIPVTIARADGNPYYLEELVNWLIDEGVIVCEADAWQINTALPFPPPVPSTLTSILQARLENLSDAEKRTLQCASVVGRVFWDDAVLALQADDSVLRATSTASSIRAGNRCARHRRFRLTRRVMRCWAARSHRH